MSNLWERQVFLSFCNYYDRFVFHFTYISAPLYVLILKELTWHWTDTEESAMRSLCAALCSHPVLALPDFTKPFHIESDTSDTNVGGVLRQMNAFIHKPIDFLSNKLSNSERNYSVHGMNCLQLLLIAKLSTPTLMAKEL